MAKYIVESGESSDGIIIEKGGSMLILDGGVANSTIVNSMGRISISSGGVANSTTVNSRGSISISSGGTAVETTVNSLGFVFISSGGVANSTTVNSRGSISISSGGTAIDTVISSGVSFSLSSGVTLSGIELNEQRIRYSEDYGVVMNDVVLNGGSLSIYLRKYGKGPVISGATVNSKGRLDVSSGCSVTDVVLNSGGIMNIFRQGVLSNATVNSGGSLRIDGNGAAIGVVENGGYVNSSYWAEVCFLPNSFSDLKLSNASATVHEATTASRTELGFRGKLTVFKNGKALDTTVNSGGSLTVSNGGSATAIVENGGYVNILDGAEVSFAANSISGLVLTDAYATVHSVTTAADITINENARCDVFEAGKLGSATVNAGGSLTVLSRGSATAIAENGGYVSYEDGAEVSFTANTFSDLVLTGVSATVHSVTTATNITISEFGELDVFSGGKANSISLDSISYLNVESGGIATGIVAEDGAVLRFAVAQDGWIQGVSGGFAFEMKNAHISGYTVAFDGNLLVCDGGTAESISVESSGDLLVSSGGTANGIVENGGYVELLNGATATFSANTFSGLVLNDASATVHSGTTATGTIIGNNGILAVFDGGTLAETTVNGGSINVSGGAMAKETTVNSGNFNISGGATAQETTIIGGNFNISGGATAEATIVNGGGFNVYDGGTANDTFFNSGSFTAFGGAVLNGITINGGQLNISAGVVLNSAAVNTGGKLNISSGGTASAITENGGYVFLGDDADASFTPNTFSGLTLSYSTSATVHSGTMATGITVNSGGGLFVYNGGKTEETTVNSGGRLQVESGGAADNALINGGYLSVSGGTANDATVNGGNIYVSSGMANDATVNGGNIYVFGGMANNATVNGGNIYVSGGMANNATVNTGGRLYVYNGGMANDAKVNSGGHIYVHSGGTADNIIEIGGFAELEDGAKATFASNTFSGLVLTDASATVHSGTTATDTTIGSGGSLTVFIGGVMNRAAVNSGGFLLVDEGGLANNIVENGGYVELNDGAEATFAANTFSGLVLTGASATVHSGTTATDLTVQNGGYFYICGGMANDAMVNGGNFFVQTGGTANGVMLNSGGSIYVSGTANDATINDGFFLVFNGGTADSITVNTGGRLYVYNGGMADNAKVNSGGRLHVYNDGTATGIVENGGYVDCEADAEATFASNTFSGLILSDASATVHSGTTATELAVQNGGALDVCGGMANGVTIDGGYLNVYCGMAKDVTLNAGGSVQVHSGGAADTVSIADGARFDIFSGGTATNVLATRGTSLNFEVTSNTLIRGTIDGKEFELKDSLLSGYTMLNGSVGVASGGTANDTVIHSGTQLHISSGGVANGTIVENGWLDVSSGAKANGVTVNSGGSIIISYGAVANSIVENGGYAEVMGEGNAAFAANSFGGLVLSAASATVHSGTTATNVSVASNGGLAVFSGGTATGIDASEGAWLSLTVAPGTYIQGKYGDSAFEIKDAFLSGYTVNAGGHLYVQSDGAAEETTVSNGCIYVAQGGTANDVTLNSGGCIQVSCGGAADGITVNDGGWAYVMKGGTVDNVTINSYGGLDVVSDGVADGVTVNAGGELYVFSGGTATNIVWTPCVGSVSIEEGASVSFAEDLSGVYYGIDEQLRRHVDTLESQTVSGGSIIVMSGGVVNDISLERAGLAVFSKGTANKTVLNSYGALDVKSGGAVSDITVNSGGTLHISAGGTATAIVENGGYVYLADGANVTFVSNTFSGLSQTGPRATLHSGTTALACIFRTLIISEGGVASACGYGAAYVLNGGLLADTETYDSSVIHVSSGGTAAHTLIGDRASMFVSSGGVAVGNEFWTWRTPGRLIVLSGGIASNTLFQHSSNGELWVSSGGTAIRTSAPYSSGSYSNRIRVFDGGVVIDTIVNKSIRFEVSAGATAIGTILESGGKFDVKNNVLAGSTTILQGSLSVQSGGRANDTVIQSNGYCSINDGGIADGVAVSSGGSLSIGSGGMLSGRITCNGGGIFADTGAIVNFDLTQITPGADARINDLSEIHGDPRYTLTVAPDVQPDGTYLLAEGASDFGRTISVVNTVGTELGVLSVGDVITVDGTAYSLDLSDGTLTLTIGEKPIPPGSQYTGVVIEDGSMQVESGQLFLETRILSGGRLSVLSGGTADGIAVEPDGKLDILSGGTAIGIVADSGACLAFAVADDTVVAGISAGSSFETRNGFVSGYGIASGRLDVLSGGTADSVAVLSGGELGVFSGGTATAIVWTPGVGSVSIAEGAYVTFAGEYSGVYFGSADRLISHAAVLDGLTLGSAADAYVMSGGTAIGASVESDGQLHVSSGGTALDVVWTPCVGSISIAEGAYVTFAEEYSGVYFGSSDRLISHAAILDGLMLGSSASVYVMSDGTASGATVGSRSSMFVFSGGIASDVTVGPDGYLAVSSGGLTKDATLLNGDLHVFSGGYALAIIVSSGGRMSLASGGTAVGVYLMDSMRISAGRVVGVMISSGGKMTADGGALEYNVVCSDGELFVGGGDVTSTTVSSGGSAVFSGGKADTVVIESGGSLEILSNCIASGMEIRSGGAMTIADGGFVNSILLRGGLTVDNGGTVDGTTIMYGGTANINNGGEASGTLISSGGTMTLNGGSICNTVIRGGSLLIESGTLTEFCAFMSGYVSAMDGAVLNLDLTRTQPGIAAKINRLSSISGDLSLTVTIDADDQAEGVYLLADGATEFDRTITVLGTDGTGLGALSCGETVTIGETTYALSLSNGTLTLRIGEGFTPSTYTSDGLVFGGSSRSVLSGEIFHDTTVLYGGSLIVSSGGTAINTMLAEETARLYLGFGGNASGATVLSGGGIQIMRGGVLNDATVSSIGGIYIYEGGIAYDAKITEDGNLRIYSGGIASNITISSGGTLWLNAGGTATDITLASGASLECVLTSETYLTGTSGGSAFEIKAGAVSDVVLTSVSLYVRPGGSVDNVTINSGGSIRVLFNTQDKCIANNITVNPGGRLDVMPRGSAMVAFNPWSGGIIAAKNAKITYLQRDAKVYYGCSASGLISKANVMDDLEILSGNSAIVYYDGLISNARVDANGLLLVDADGNASNTVVRRNGEMKIVSGGTATNARIESGGWLLCEEAFLDGKVSIAFGGSLRAEKYRNEEEEEMDEEVEADTFISACDGLVLDFDLTRTGSESGISAMVNDLSVFRGTPVYTLTVGSDGKPGTHSYVLAEGATEFNSTITVQNTLGETLGTLTIGQTLTVGYNSYTLSLTDSVLSVTIEPSDMTPSNPIGTAEKVSWKTTGANSYIVEYSMDNFEHAIQMVTTASAIDMPDLPAGNYQWRVKADANSDWAVGEAIVSEADFSTPKVVQAVEDGNDDLFFATTNGTWENIYYAQHVGSINDWTGTNEIISANGKGRIQNLFFGSADPNVLCLTDGENGDAIFVDDVYTDLPEGIEEHTARLYKIQEVRAGFGNDIVDMTSQRFEYFGEGLTIRGGAGNDTIWANKGNNWLFGDAGNDRIVGASGNDVIAGGIGNDRMHGGGGDDVFTFCDNWGVDNVEQLATGSVTLWFASGDESNWNAETMTYTDGENSVKVTGVSEVTLKFGRVGDDAAMFAMLSEAGAFKEFTSQKIFEENKGLLA